MKMFKFTGAWRTITCSCLWHLCQAHQKMKWRCYAHSMSSSPTCGNGCNERDSCSLKALFWLFHWLKLTQREIIEEQLGMRWAWESLILTVKSGKGGSRVESRIRKPWQSPFLQWPVPFLLVTNSPRLLCEFYSCFWVVFGFFPDAIRLLILQWW